MHNDIHANYDHYSPEMIQRLDGFYGRVDSRMNELIEHWVIGKRVLDIGCGFGQLIEDLRKRGFEATGIDMLDDFIKAGKQKYPLADLRCGGFGEFTFPAETFDTVVLKDTLHHIYTEADIRKFWGHVRQVRCKRIIVLDPNPTPFLRLARRVIKHIDPTCSPEQAKQSLKEAGFTLTYEGYRELVAFPLSGGFVSKPFIKNYTLGSIILALDSWLVKILNVLHLSKFTCWRYIFVADIPSSE